MHAENTLSVSRSELKYEIHPIDAMRLREELDILLKRDNYSTNGSYMVRSLYFDSLNDIDFMEKYSGNQKRKKVRIRVYDPNALTGKFEIKQKDGNYSCKRSVSVSRDEILCTQNGDYAFLLKHKSETAQELYAMLMLGCYRPKTIIEYQREAFVYPQNHIRVTLDSQIRSTESNLDLLADSLDYIPIMEDRVILEVKYDGKLIKSISELLEKYRLTQVSFSKYTVGRPIYAKYIF